MNKSIFERVYSYRQRENKNARENFLIEVFAYCLQTDRKFLLSFLKLINAECSGDCNVSTQSAHTYGRPDIEIRISGEIFALIECKIDHSERQDQLKDYCKIIEEQTSQRKYLVYLTKYYEFKEIQSEEIQFSALKWLDIYEIIDESNSEITLQLREYLKEQGMSESNNFQFEDLVTLKNIGGLISKMDEVIDSIKPHFENHIGKFSKDSSRTTRLRDNYYVNYYHVYKDGKYSFGLDIGFFWWDRQHMSLGIRVYTPSNKKDSQALRTLFEKTFAWENEMEEWDNNYHYWYTKNIAEFMVEDEEQIPAMVAFLKQGINDVASLKESNPKIFG